MTAKQELAQALRWKQHYERKASMAMALDMTSEHDWWRLALSLELINLRKAAEWRARASEAQRKVKA